MLCSVLRSLRAQRSLELTFAWALAEARTRSQSGWRRCSIGEGLLSAGFGSDPWESQWNGAAGLREPQVARRDCGERRRLRSRRSSVYRMPRALSSSEALMAATYVGPVAAAPLSGLKAFLSSCPFCCVFWPSCTRVGGGGRRTEGFGAWSLTRQRALYTGHVTASIPSRQLYST